MKNLKLKLMSAIAMLMVATIGLASVSYAWFTISTNPEITSAKVNVAANENLEIALDNDWADAAAIDTASTNSSVQGGVQGSTSGNPYTWGNLIDLSQAFTTTVVYSVTGTSAKDYKVSDMLYLKPVKYVQDSTTKVATLKYPKYGTDGRIKEMDVLTAQSVTDYVSAATGTTAYPQTGTGAITASTTTDHNGVAIYTQDATVSKNKTADAVSITYWMRTNMESGTKVALSAAAKRAASGEDASAETTDTNGVMGAGSYIRLKTAGATATDDEKNWNTKIHEWLTTGKLVIRFDEVTESTNAVVESWFAVPTKTSGSDLVAADKADNANYGTTDSPAYGFTYNLTLVNSQKAVSSKYTADTIDLSKNTAKMIVMYIYLDGENITNADAFEKELANALEINIQFKGTDGTNVTVDDAMDVK